jgi:hypothetical protein
MFVALFEQALGGLLSTDDFSAGLIGLLVVLLGHRANAAAGAETHSATSSSSSESFTHN